jgi:TLC domain
MSSESKVQDGAKDSKDDLKIDDNDNQWTDDKKIVQGTMMSTDTTNTYINTITTTNLVTDIGKSPDSSQTTLPMDYDDLDKEIESTESKTAAMTSSSSTTTTPRKRLLSIKNVAEQIRDNRRRHLQKLRQIQEEEEQQQLQLVSDTNNNIITSTPIIRPKRRSIIEDHFRIESIVQPSVVPVSVPVRPTTQSSSMEMTQPTQSTTTTTTAAAGTITEQTTLSGIGKVVTDIDDKTTMKPIVSEYQSALPKIRQGSFGQFFTNTAYYQNRGYKGSGERSVNDNLVVTDRRNISTAPVATKSSASSSTGVMRSLRMRRQIQQQQKVKQPKHRIVVLPGAPTYEEDWARDSHDFFNLVALVPVVALNVMNWNWDIMFIGCTKIYSQYKKYYYFQYIVIQHWLVQLYLSLFGNDNYKQNSGKLSSSSYHYNHHLYNPKDDIAFTKILETSWTDEWFETFFNFTVFYFVIDLFWVYAIPQAVRSPSTIIQHHIATLCYIIIPYWYPQCRWVMGACMIVEINTWFLIARRVFNKQGFPPWTIVDFSFLSIRIKIISIMFYTTWISIRCILYPLLVLPIYTLYSNECKRTNNTFNLIGLCLPLHTIFCMLNIKWSYDLLMSKIRYWRRLHTIRKNNMIMTSTTTTNNNSGNGTSSPTNNKTNKYITDLNNNYVDKGL